MITNLCLWGYILFLKKLILLTFSESYAKEFFPGEVEEDDRTYYFDTGQIAVEVAVRKNITKEEYYVMRKYLAGSTY